jgi:hypothetical protein
VKTTPSIFATTRQQRQAVLDAAEAGVLVDLPASIVPADHKVIRDGATATRREREAARVALLPPVELVRPDVRIAVADARRLPLTGPIVDLTVTSPISGLEVDYDTGDIDPSLWEPFVYDLANDVRRVTKPHGHRARSLARPEGARAACCSMPCLLALVTAEHSALWHTGALIMSASVASHH